MSEEPEIITPESLLSIGSAHMSADGTITLRLRGVGPGIVGDATVTYAPNHKEYTAVLEHVGGLTPGEIKPVPPWD